MQQLCLLTFVVVCMCIDRAQELKDHAFFVDVDWQQVYQQKYPPPLIPPRGEVNAADAFDIGSFDEEDTKGIKVQRRFPQFHDNNYSLVG